LAWGADYLLCFDVDHTFPADALERMLSWKQPIVGANYLRRDTPPRPAAARRNDAGEMEIVWSTREKAQRQPLERVEQMGMGLCLIEASCLDRIARPFFDFRRAEGHILGGEDVWFFTAASAAGIPVHVDHALSMEVGHIDRRPLNFPG
jgi:hypothetical protein